MIRLEQDGRNSFVRCHSVDQHLIDVDQVRQESILVKPHLDFDPGVEVNSVRWSNLEQVVVFCFLYVFFRCPAFSVGHVDGRDLLGGPVRRGPRVLAVPKNHGFG